MPRKYSTEVRRQVVTLARSGTPVAQLKSTFGIGSSTIYNWLTQEKIDRGEIEGVTSDQTLELAAARKRIRQLENDLAISRKVNEIFLSEGQSPKGSTR